MNEEASKERDQARVETARLEAEILDAAREVTQSIEREGRERIEREVNQLRADLQRQSQLIARQIASKVLGREVAS